MKFIFHHNGDSEVGINGEMAEVVIGVDGFNEADQMEHVAHIKETLTPAFKEVFGGFKTHCVVESEAVKDEPTESNTMVLKRITPETVLSRGEKPEGVKYGLVVDTETTGINPSVDKMVEIGLVLFSYDPDTGRIFDVESYSSLDDPGCPISPEASAVSGITDEMVKGQRADDGIVQNMVAKADVIIAHNADFDRKVLERRFPDEGFKSKPWACSMSQIDWKSEGISTKKLDYIAFRLGLFYDAHRVEADCLAVLGVLSKKLPVSGEIGLVQLHKNHSKPAYIVSATGARFEAKDALKGNGYSWNPDNKVWFKEVGADDYKDEMEWLASNVYMNRIFSIQRRDVNEFNRFSDRRAVNQVVKGIPFADDEPDRLRSPRPN
jgi:DNA polymerase-3 subunit epsilon